MVKFTEAIGQQDDYSVVGLSFLFFLLLVLMCTLGRLAVTAIGLKTTYLMYLL